MTAPGSAPAAPAVGAMPVVRALLLLDADGKRIAVKYYTAEWSTVHQQAEFEKAVFAKTARVNARGEAEVSIMDDCIVVFKTIGDLTFYTVGGLDENEVVLSMVLTAFYESVSLLLRGAVDKKTVLENLDLVLLAVDEIVDRGLILETDAPTAAARASMAGADGDVPLAEQTLSKVMATAKEQLARSLLK